MIYVFTEMIMTTGCMRRERMSTEREVGKKSASSTNFDLLIVFMESVNCKYIMESGICKYIIQCKTFY